MIITIVGGGVAGLTAAISLALANHNITLLESSLTPPTLGAGVHLTPNAIRYWWQLGLKEDILSHAVLPASFNIRQDSDDTLLRSVSFEDLEKEYGAPYLVIHRVNLHHVLYSHAIRAGVTVRLGSEVGKYNFESGGLKLVNGEAIQSDLVVACDGINSLARNTLLPPDTEVGPSQTKPWLQKTGWAAYQLTARISALLTHPLTLPLARDQSCNCWAGDNRSTLTYLTKDAKNVDIVLSHPDDIDTSSFRPPQYRGAVEAALADASPTLQALLAVANPKIHNWPVYQVKSLPRWTSRSGKFVLMGDAAHAMAFHLSMGVALAVEDAEVLAICLSLMAATKGTLEHAMRIFELVRKPRVEAAREASLYAGRMLHLGAGEERSRRDRAMAEDGERDGRVEGEESGKFWEQRKGYGIADQGMRDWCYGYDAEEEVLKVWDGVRSD